MKNNIFSNMSVIAKLQNNTQNYWENTSLIKKTTDFVSMLSAFEVIRNFIINIYNGYNSLPMNTQYLIMSAFLLIPIRYNSFKDHQ